MCACVAVVINCCTFIPLGYTKKVTWFCGVCEACFGIVSLTGCYGGVVVCILSALGVGTEN